jgi:hypothetical protein
MQGPVRWQQDDKNKEANEEEQMQDDREKTLKRERD